jgi:hypothetical protein
VSSLYFLQMAALEAIDGGVDRAAFLSRAGRAYDERARHGEPEQVPDAGRVDRAVAAFPRIHRSLDAADDRLDVEGR